MTLGDVITQLKYGELRSIAAKDDNVAITSYINLALIALYSRFDLLSKETFITLQDNVTNYTLPTDLINITSVWKEDGSEIVLDDETNPFGVFQTSFNTIQVLNPITGNTLSIIYSAVPTSLVYVDTNNLTDVVPIPPQLLEPLLHYVGYRAHGSMNGDIKAENNTHYMRYEAACKRVEEMGLVRREVVPAHVSKAEAISDEQVPYYYV